MSYKIYTSDDMIKRFYQYLSKIGGMDSEDYNFLLNLLACWTVLVSEKSNKELAEINQKVLEHVSTLDSGFQGFIVGRN